MRIRTSSTMSTTNTPSKLHNIAPEDSPPPPPAPAPSAIPFRPAPPDPPPSSAPPPGTSSQDNKTTTESSSPTITLPTLRLNLEDLSHPTTAPFLTSCLPDPSTLLRRCSTNVLKHLYFPSTLDNFVPSSPPCPQPKKSTLTPPPTFSVTTILRPMEGVAYTTGTRLDPLHHKEIHLSLSYLSTIHTRSPSLLPSEIEGVLTHELVHCHQHSANHTAPGGLIEGMADWVRLKCNLSPPHWRQDPVKAGRWDAGYQNTAYFLEYLEGRFGMGTVRGINERLRMEGGYEGEGFWVGLLGWRVERLWEDYCVEFEAGDGKDKKGNKGEDGEEVAAGDDCIKA